MTQTTPSADKIYQIAKGELGYHEGSNNQNKYAGPVGVPNNDAWCTTFASWLFLTAGYKSLCLMSDYSVDQYNWFNSRGRANGYPAVGAVVWYGPGGNEHTGWVYAYDADYIYTIEGNWDDQVTTMKRPRREALNGLDIFMYGYPNFAEGVVTADPDHATPGSVYAATASVNKTGTTTPPTDGGGTTTPPPASGLPWVSYLAIAAAAASSSGKATVGGSSSTDDVLNYQKGLKKLDGSYDYSSGPGTFGPLTHAATKTFQLAQGWTGDDADGNPGPTTITLVGSKSNLFQVRDFGTTTPPADGGGDTPPAERPYAWSSFSAKDGSGYTGSVSVVQAALAKEFPGTSFTADAGKWKTQSLAAYSKWQVKLGYTGSPSQKNSDANGRAGQDSLTKLAEKYTFDVKASPGGYNFTASGDGDGPDSGTNPPAGGDGGTVTPPPATGGWVNSVAINNKTGVSYARYSGGGNVASWIAAACALRGITGATAVANWTRGYQTAISRESSGDANACNTNDSNNTTPSGFSRVADYGTGYGSPSGNLGGQLVNYQCSRGVAQCIPQTFANWHCPGASNMIYDPVANIASSMGYVADNYNVSDDGHDLASKVQQFDPNRSPAGY
jgi:hypothetical protein